MFNMEIYEKSRSFESEDVARIYLLAGFLNEWQKETGGTLEQFMEYIDKTCAKKTRAPRKVGA